METTTAAVIAAAIKAPPAHKHKQQSFPQNDEGPERKHEKHPKKKNIVQMISKKETVIVTVIANETVIEIENVTVNVIETENATETEIETETVTVNAKEIDVHV